MLIAYEIRLVDYLAYSVGLGSLSTKSALILLDDIADKSPAASYLTGQIKKIVFSAQKNDTIIDRSLYVNSMLFSTLTLEHIDFLTGFVSAHLERLIAFMETLTSQIEENTSFFLFAIFFIPTFATQLCLLLGTLDIIILLPLSTTSLTLYLISNVKRLGEKLNDITSIHELLSLT